MASDFHIKFDGIDGESSHKDHKNQIEVLSWEWEVTQPSGASYGGGSGQGKASPGAFKFTHFYDKASPVLAKHAVSGKHFPKVTVTARKSGDGQQDFLTVTMKEAFITRVHHGASSGGKILEDVSISYKDIEYGYKPQDAQGGLSGEVKFGWNVETTETR